MTDTQPRNLPRFLPTLTEVVDEAALVQAPAAATSEIEEIVLMVMERMQGLIENRLSNEINAVVGGLMDEHWQRLRLRLRQELELDVRQAVLEAITRRSAAQN
jgi:hypothetical protein